MLSESPHLQSSSSGISSSFHEETGIHHTVPTRMAIISLLAGLLSSAGCVENLDEALIGGREPTDESGADAYPQSYTEYGLPTGICVTVDEETTFFENFYFVSGDPHVGITFDQLAAGRVSIQASPDSRWHVFGISVDEGPYVEGNLEADNIEGHLDDGGISFRGLHDEFAGSLFALDGTLVTDTDLGTMVRLTLRDSESPEFDTANRRHFTGGPLTVLGETINPDSAKLNEMRRADDETSWIMQACP